MHHHPALVGPVIREQVAGLRHDAELHADGRHHAPGRRVIEAATQPTGWLLIEVGLRLAVPRCKTQQRPARETLAHRTRSA